MARSKISFSLEIFNLARNLEFFDLWALWGMGPISMAVSGHLIHPSSGNSFLKGVIKYPEKAI